MLAVAGEEHWGKGSFCLGEVTCACVESVARGQGFLDQL